VADKKATGDAGWANLDIGQILSQFQVPGIDVQALIERERANIQAVQQANRIAFEGWQGLMSRQAEMIREAMTAWQESVAGTDGATAPNASAQAQQAMENALANMRELAEMATRSQTEAAEVIRRRFEENLQELRAQLTPKR
jgi:phasin family protein